MDPRIETGRRWRYAFASAIGSSHIKNGSPCQDASVCDVVELEGNGMLVAVASDGAGSARHSRIGSRLACFILSQAVKDLLGAGQGIEAIDQRFATTILERFQQAAENVARLAGCRRRDFACTLLAAFVGEDRAAYLQIGDGAIVVSRTGATAPDDYDWVFWPQQGEYANETLFATGSYAAEKLQFLARYESVEEVALFSDGIQNLVLDYKNKKAHSGFFRPMFGAVRRLAPGHSGELSTHLEKYLGSRSILSRTDDDKTLILASRRHPAPAAPLPSGRRPAEEESRTGVTEGAVREGLDEERAG